MKRWLCWTFHLKQIGATAPVFAPQSRDRTQKPWVDLPVSIENSRIDMHHHDIADDQVRCDRTIPYRDDLAQSAFERKGSIGQARDLHQ
jgi:hypothetical protein